MRRFVHAFTASVEEFKSKLTETLSDPFRYAHLVHAHEDDIDVIRATAKPRGQLKRAGKRKRAETLVPNEGQPVEVGQLRAALDSVRLKSWL